MELIEYKDMFGIYWRIKNIRQSYKLYLNRKTNKVELHDTNFGGKCMVFSLPILPDVLNKINESRIENSNLIFRKIEQENMKNDIKNTQKAINFAKSQIFNL